MKRFYLLLVCLCFIPVGLWAQMTVTGTVLDENGEGAIGANVIVEGTTIGTVTDLMANSRFRFPTGRNRWSSLTRATRL